MIEQPKPVGEALQEKVASVTVQFMWADRQSARRREGTLRRIAEEVETLVRDYYSNHPDVELHGYEEVGALVKHESILTLRTVVTPNLEDSTPPHQVVGVDYEALEERVRSARDSLTDEDRDQIAEDKALARAEEWDEEE